VDADKELGQGVVGSYRLPGLLRWPPLLTAPLMIATAVTTPDPITIAIAAGYCLLAAVGWLLPATVITEREVLHPILRRTYALSDVASCQTVSGWTCGVVLTMRDGDRVRLQGVPSDGVPGVRALVSRVQSQVKRSA